MRNLGLAASSILLSQLLPAFAADVDIHVIVPGDVRAGIYGRVDIGSAPPPPVVYAKPIVAVRRPHPEPVQPIYLHVPPGHAKHWSKHCKQYNACGVPVYFVRSEEYDGKKEKKGGKGKEKK